MNMLDKESRRDLYTRLVEHFEPLQLDRFIVIGFSPESGFVFEIAPVQTLCPQAMQAALHQVADSLDMDDPLKLEER
jgi:hypothetical protein